MQEANAEVARQVVDPAVSQQKFEQEVNIFCNNIDYQRNRGVILLDAQFPDVYLAFSAPQLRPAPIVFAVKINFENYDLEPLSIKFIDPFSYELLNVQQVHTPFINKISVNNGQITPHTLLQSETTDGVPFLCLPGVREYHNHPYHSGDSWFLHRKLSGEGTLGFLVDKMHEYGISTIGAYKVSVQAKIDVDTLALGVNIHHLPQ